MLEAVPKSLPCPDVSSTIVRTSPSAYESAPSATNPTSDSPRIRGLTFARLFACGTRVRLTWLVAAVDVPGRTMGVGNH
jgi:hypothetical protein